MMEEEQKPEEDFYPEKLEDAIKSYYDTYGNGNWGFDHLSYSRFKDIVETFVKDYGQKPIEWSYPYGKNETVDQLIAIAECLEMDGEYSFNGYKGKDCGKFLRELARRESENKPAEWSDTDELVFQDICKHLNEEGFGGWVVLLEALKNGEFSNPTDDNNTVNVNMIADPLTGEKVPFVSYKNQGQKPAEWKLPDDFKTAVRNVTNFISPFSDPNDFNRVVDRFAEQLFELAKKEVNKPAEWSKEDKEMIELLSWLLDYEKKFCKKSQAGAAVMRQYEDAKKWLKSLRPHWKPSEEQMNYLKKAILYCIQDGNEKTANVIKELYEDLKKL